MPRKLGPSEALSRLGILARPPGGAGQAPAFDEGQAHGNGGPVPPRGEGRAPKGEVRRPSVNANIQGAFRGLGRLITQGYHPVREKQKNFKVREKSGNFAKSQGKSKSVKSQGFFWNSGRKVRDFS